MRVDRLDKALRLFITLFIFLFYIGMVFFSISGNYNFLLTFEYWYTVSSSTAVALFLRWIYSDVGLEVELNKNEKITAKESAKASLINDVIENNLVDVLEAQIAKDNDKEKLEEYRIMCDRKINFYREKAWWKPFRLSNLKKWKERKENSYKEDFNIKAYRIKYYKRDLDEMLSSFYKEPKRGDRYRRTKNQKVINSTRTNVLSLIAMATLKGAELLYSEWTREDALVLAGQIIVFILNMYTGYGLGKSFIKEDYSQNLSDDFAYLKKFLKLNQIKNVD